MDEHRAGTLPLPRRYSPGPVSSSQNGTQYATLSRQCKTLESADFY